MLAGSVLQLSEAEQDGVHRGGAVARNKEGERTSAAGSIEVFEARPYGLEPLGHAHLPTPPNKQPSWAACSAWARWSYAKKEILEPQRSDRLRSPTSRRQGLVLVAQAGGRIVLRRSNTLKRFHQDFFGWRAAHCSRTTATAMREALAREAA